MYARIDSTPWPRPLTGHAHNAFVSAITVVKSAWLTSIATPYHATQILQLCAAFVDTMTSRLKYFSDEFKGSVYTLILNIVRITIWFLVGTFKGLSI